MPWAVNVLQHLAYPLLTMFPDPHTILDGELYVHNWPLQRINGAVAINRTAPSDDTPYVCYYVFDQVKYGVPFFQRFKEVDDEIKARPHDNICSATTVQAPDHAFVESFYANVVASGYEGIMYRIGLCPYTVPKQPKEHEKGFLSDKNNRTWHLLKRKDWQDDEFTCVGVEEGVGKRAGMVGAFICATKSDTIFGVGSGLTDAEATHYFINQPIGRPIKVKFLTYTNDGIPFNPTIEAVL